MAINSDTDINLALLQLGKNENQYTLDQTPTPHKIISWHPDNKDKQPSDDELNAAFLSWKAAEEYKVKRAEEYPKFEDQFDQIYNEGIDAWKASIKTIKDKYPKP